MLAADVLSFQAHDCPRREPWSNPPETEGVWVGTTAYGQELRLSLDPPTDGLSPPDVGRVGLDDVRAWGIRRSARKFHWVLLVGGWVLVVRSLQWCGARRARGRACHQPQTGAEYGEDGTVGDHGGDHQHANREEHQGPEQGVTAQRYREVGSAQPGAARSRKSSPSVMTNAITAARPTTTPHPNNRRLAPDGAAAPTGSARTASTAATRPAAVPSSTTWMPIIIQSAETGEARRSCPSTMLGPPLALHPLLGTSTCPPELGMGHGWCSCRTRRTRPCVVSAVGVATAGLVT